MSNSIGDTLKALRKSRGMSQDELSQKSGVHRISIARYESGARKPDVDSLVKLAEALNTTTDAILGLGPPPSLYVPDGYYMLDADEQKLITRFRKLDSDRKEALLGLAISYVLDIESNKSQGQTEHRITS